jgi:hypothetical protein
MRSPLSGSIATLVFFVPLVGVPLLAVVGMPQFSPHAAKSGDDLKFAAADPASGAGNADLLEPVRVSDPHGDAAAPNHDAKTAPREGDPFAEFNRDGDAASSQSKSTGIAEPKQPPRWHSEGNGLPQRALFSKERASDDHAAATPSGRTAASSALDDQASQQPANDRAASDGATNTPVTRRALPEAEAVVGIDTERPAAPARSHRASASLDGNGSAASDTRLTAARTGNSDYAVALKRAVGRLNALGIRDYQLQPGTRDGEFNFSCRFASRTNPSVIHRFEADAADPLDAVNQVLKQLDEWRARRVQRTQASREVDGGAGRQASSGAESSEVEVTNRAF